MADDPVAEQARRRSAVLEGRPSAVPDDDVVAGDQAELAVVEEPRRAKRRRGPVPVLSGGEPRGFEAAQPVRAVSGVVLVADDAVVVRLSEVADVLNGGGDPARLGVSVEDATAELVKAGWRASWTPPVDE